MKRALVVLLFGCLTLGVASLAVADPDITNFQAAISVHVTPVVTKNVCTTNQPHPTSATMVTDVQDPNGCTGGLGSSDYSIWILVCNANDSTGIAGMEFGISYDGAATSGIDVQNWSLCGDLDFPSGGSDGQPTWPADGSGNIITWAYDTNCQQTLSEPYVPNTVVAIGGALNVSLYSPDLFSITPRPVSGFLKVANCHRAETNLTGVVPSHAGAASFCTGGSYNPCGAPTPAKETTWGKIKQQYN